MARISFPWAMENCPQYWKNFCQWNNPQAKYVDVDDVLVRYGAKIFSKDDFRPSDGFWLEFETEAQMIYFIMEWS